MKVPQEYADLAQGLLDYYSDRNVTYEHIDDLFNMRWDFPDGMPDWTMKVVSSDPHDAILTTVRTFATIKPVFKVLPMLNDEANRTRANQVETAIGWNFKKAAKRMPGTVEWQAMLSATLYAQVAAQVVYLPYQEKILEAMGKDSRRVKATRKYGDFAFIFHNPANIYPEWSEYGLEGVLTVKLQTVEEFMATWGDLANKVVDEKDYADGRISYVTSYDYTNYEKRCVWGVYSDTEIVQTEGEGIVILEEENKLGFIPYVITQWGNSLSSVTSQQVKPLLQPVYDSGQWDMLNVLSSLDASLTIKRAAQPTFAGMFPPNTDPEIDNTEPAGVLKIPQGTQGFTPLAAQSFDQRLSMQKAEFTGKVWQATISKILNTLDIPSGAAYSTVNQMLTQATSSLSPYKMLAERTLAELAHLMLCWVKYYGKEYGKVDLYGQYEDKTNSGTEVRIASDTIDPDEIQIEVTLTPDIPVDKLQQINGAVLVYQNFPVPASELVETLGYGDASDLAKRRAAEDYLKVYMQADQQRIAMQPQLEAQQMQMQQQMAQQQEMAGMQMQQEMQARMQEQQMSAAANNESPAMENIGGPGFNPAGGGTPPVQAARGQR